MRKLIVLFIIVSTLGGCGIIEKLKPSEIVVTESQLTNQINVAIPELLNQQWLSDYLVQNETRPVVISGAILNETSGSVNKEILYDAMDLNLVSTGRIRVLKSTKTQRSLTPDELLDSENIKFVITLNIISNLDQKAAECIYKVWEKGSDKPVGSLTRYIKDGVN